MDRGSKNGLLNSVVLVIVAAGAFAVGRYTNSLAGQVAAVFVALGFVVSLVSLFHMWLEERERLERLEFDELVKGRASGGLFKENESDVFPAQKSREQFERFFVPAVTILLMIGQGIGAWLLWGWLKGLTRQPFERPAVALAFFGVFFLFLFVVGRYSSGLARLRKDRLLRPGANHLLLSAYACAVVAVTLVAAWSQFPMVDYYVAMAGAVFLGLFAAENLLSLILELYRPRVKGKAARLLYESRLVGLLSHPESLFSTAAHALDYQFGFKVSETWAYQSFRRYFPYVLWGQVAILLLSSCVVFIETGEQGLMERFGSPVANRAVLNPGVHVKWFWPVDRVQRFRTDQIQTFNIGFVHEEKDDHAARPQEEVVLWTVSHYNEEFNLLVASRDTGAGTNSVEGRKVPPVNLLSVSIPVQFQISDLRKWAYGHLRPAQVLEEIGTREVVRYLVGVDLLEIMSTARFKAAEELRNRIQKRADELDLGVRIVFLGLQDIHPPVAVASSYEAVIGAEQKRIANRLSAQADAVATNGWSQAEAVRRKSDAEADKERLVMDSAARAAQFTNQVPAYEAAPAVYAQLAYFQALNRGGAGTRKIAMAVTNTEDVILLNLEEKLRPDILDLPLPEAPKPR